MGASAYEETDIGRTRECAFCKGGTGCSPSADASKVAVHQAGRPAKFPKVDRVDDESAEGGEAGEVGSEGFEDGLWAQGQGAGQGRLKVRSHVVGEDIDWEDIGDAEHEEVGEGGGDDFDQVEVPARSATAENAERV